MRANTRPTARLLMTHKAAFHTLFSRNDQSNYGDNYKEHYTFKAHELKKLVDVMNKDHGRIHQIDAIALVGA